MVDLIIENGIILTMDASRRIIANGSIVIDSGKIVDVDKSDKIKNKYAADQKIDAKKSIVMPGLIDTHTHLFQMLGKGLGDDRSLLDWIKSAWTTLAKGITANDYYIATLLGCAEAIKSGTTCLLAFEHILNAIPEATDYIVKAFHESNIRAILGRGFEDTGTDMGLPDFLIKDKNEIIKECEKAIRKWNHSNEDKIRVWLAPGWPPWTTPELFRAIQDLAKEYDTGITTHIDESKDEVEYYKKHLGMRGVEYLNKLGILDKNLLLVHCVWTTEQDITILKNYDVKISHNPVSNMYLASGVAPIPKMLTSNLTVGLGLDGATSNNNQDMFELMKTTALLHKVASCDPIAITAEKVLEMATIDGAKALGLESEIGSIEIGKKADIILIDLNQPNVTPVIYPPSTLVYSANGSNVKTVIIDGKIVMKDRKLITINEEELIEKAQKSIDDLLKRVGYSEKRKWKII